MQNFAYGNVGRTLPRTKFTEIKLHAGLLSRATCMAHIRFGPNCGSFFTLWRKS